MNEKQLFAHIVASHGQEVAREAVYPKNMGVMHNPHSRGEHVAANGDSVTFFIKVEGDKVSEITFVAKGGAVVFAASSVATRMFRGMKMRFVLASLDPELFMEELPNLTQEDQFSLMLVCEAMKKAVLNALGFIREPWKRHYSKG